MREAARGRQLASLRALESLVFCLLFQVSSLIGSYGAGSSSRFTYGRAYAYPSRDPEHDHWDNTGP